MSSYLYLVSALNGKIRTVIGDRQCQRSLP